MADHFLIEFEQINSPPEVEINAAFRKLEFFALAGPPQDGVLLTRLPALRSSLQARVVGTIAPPAINTLFGAFKPLTVRLSDRGTVRLDARLKKMTARLFDQPQQGILEASFQPLSAHLSDQPPVPTAHIRAFYDPDWYTAIWTGHISLDLVESIAISTTTAISQIIVLRERLNIATSNVSLLQTALSLTETVVLRDVVALVWQVLLEEVVELGSTADQFLTAVIRATERLRLSAVVSSEREAIVALAETLALADAAQYTWLAELLETMELGDAIDARIQAMVTMLETLELADSADMTLTATAALREEVAVGLDASTQLDANVVLREALELVGTLRINGDVYSCWLINTESKGIARYTNYPFNSFARWPGTNTYIGATDTGLHELGGDTDAGDPIRAVIRSALTDFGSRQLKRVPTMYLGYTTSGETLVLKVIHTSETGAKTEDWYRLEGRNAPEVREDRFKVGRGIASVFLGFEIVNVNGADFALDVVEWQPIRLDRKVR